MSKLKLSNQEIIDLYSKGKSMNSIAELADTYPTTIQRILQKHDITLRHDKRQKGKYYVEDGQELIEWAKAQGKLLTKAELAAHLGKTRLSSSYFMKYPELGNYIKTHEQKSNTEYITQLHTWLQQNNIFYKPNDKYTIGVMVDVILLGEYSNIAIQIDERPYYVSKPRHEEMMKTKLNRATEKGVAILFLNKEHFECLDDIKPLLDAFKK